MNKEITIHLKGFNSLPLMLDSDSIRVKLCPCDGTDPECPYADLSEKENSSMTELEASTKIKRPRPPKQKRVPEERLFYKEGGWSLSGLITKLQEIQARRGDVEVYLQISYLGYDDTEHVRSKVQFIQDAPKSWPRTAENEHVILSGNSS